MSTESNVTTVRAFYAGLLSDDAEPAVVEFLDPDVVWENPLPDDIPFGGTFRGHKGAARYLGLALGALDLEELKVEEMLAQDDRVVVLGRMAGVVKRTGRPFSIEWVHVLRVRSGRIVALREYNDTAALHVAFA